MVVLQFIANNIIGNPGILFGLIALTGLMLQKRSFSDTLMGVVKTIIGYEILCVGCGPLQAACNAVGDMISLLMGGATGIIPQNWMIQAASTAEFGTEVGLTVLVGFIVNLILARVTKLKYVALTGQILVIWASFAVGVVGGYEGVSTMQIVLFCGVFCGIYNWLATAVSHYFMKKSGNMTDEYALYVTEITGIAVTSWLSRLIGNKEKRCDDMEVPEWLEWVRDTTVCVTTISIVIWTIIGIICGPANVATLTGGSNWFIWLIFQGVDFGAGLTIVLFGVRMMLAEIVPAFKGIATKVIPGAIAGLDYPTSFQFAPMAVFIGFFANLAGAVAATLLMTALGFDIIVLPAIWMNFWTGGMLGVFADCYGGRRATVIVCFLMGLIVPFGWAAAYPLAGSFLSTLGATADYTDTATIGLVYEHIVKLIFGR